MRWTVHGERSIYDSDWVNLRLVDVELPDGSRFEHHVIRLDLPAAGTVVTVPGRGVLMLWRHRFISDTWGWEIPAGRVDPGEEAIGAAARECEEETGWRPGPLTLLTSYRPSNGLSDQVFKIYGASSAAQVGEPTDPNEASRVEWVSVDELRDLVSNGLVGDGMSLTGVLYALAFNTIG